MNGNSISTESLADMLEHVLADKHAIDKLRHGPARQRLRDAAGRLSTAMETQADSINRIRDTVYTSNQKEILPYHWRNWLADKA